MRRNKRKIVFVDDDSSCLKSYKICMQGFEGFEKLYFLDPEKAYEYIKNSKDVALLVTDERMPNMSGHVLINLVSTYCPAILLSGQVESSIIDILPKGTQVLAKDGIREIQIIKGRLSRLKGAA